MALVEMAPHPDLGRLSAEVLLNGNQVGTLHLRPERGWYRIDLPAETQEPGTNHLELRFSDGTAPVKPHRRRLSAELFALAVGRPDEPALRDLVAPGAPPALGPGEGEDAHTLVQVGPSRVELAFRLPPDAQIAFTPERHDLVRKANGAVGFRVSLQGEEETAPRELWNRTLTGRQRARRVVLDLPGQPGDLVRLGLHLEGRESQRLVWGLWKRVQLLGGVTPPVAGEGSAGPEPAEQPLRHSLEGTNVMLVVLDAARAPDFGCYAYSRETTPEIDRWASEGVVFGRAYTTNVFTLLAMSSMWTSLHRDQHHPGIPYNARLPRKYLTLAELLSGGGVHTAGFVSNAIAGTAFGLDRGFDEFYEIFRDHGGRADAYAKVLPQWLEAHRDRRFFLYLHVREPHFPYDPEPPFDTMFGPDGPISRDERRTLEFFEDVNQGRRAFSPAQREHLVRLYDGNLAFADRELGRLRSTMERLGLWDRTVVLVTADHGEALDEHGHVGHIRQLYEESIWIPLIVRFPRGAHLEARRIDGMVSLIDFAPTIADLMGQLDRDRARQQFQGKSLLPMLFGAEGRSVVLSSSSYDRPRYSLRDSSFKYVFNTADGAEELYDLRVDPGERHDLVEALGVRAAYYRQRLFQDLLEQRRGAASAAGAAELSPEQIENLKALGYLQ